MEKEEMINFAWTLFAVKEKICLRISFFVYCGFLVTAPHKEEKDSKISIRSKLSL